MPSSIPQPATTLSVLDDADVRLGWAELPADEPYKVDHTTGVVRINLTMPAENVLTYVVQGLQVLEEGRPSHPRAPAGTGSANTAAQPVTPREAAALAVLATDAPDPIATLLDVDNLISRVRETHGAGGVVAMVTALAKQAS